ncbi:MAG: hypothetical protein JWO36_1921 [Myxococcales bacterium]|nr:hypothetical protein [Myxococcales bacterium]
MARARSDIANTALRIFLQEMGSAYDEERGLQVYDGKKHFPEVRKFFGERCCYCGDALKSGRIAQDHLIAMNKTDLGLHAWGNVVPSCQDCNSIKQGTHWKDFLIQRAAGAAKERHKRVTDFIKHYGYAPKPSDLHEVAAALYDEVGAIAMTLIDTKIKHVRAKL